MLTVRFGPSDWGRVRFAAAPAPVLETVLMLFELRHRPSAGGRGAQDWRATVRSAFPAPARPLLSLVRSRERALYLDVSTPDAEHAFQVLQETPRSVHADNIDRIRKLAPDITPGWLRRFAERDPAVLAMLDRALRAFHATLLVPRWPSVTTAFHSDITERAATVRRDGLAAMLNGLGPDLRLGGDTLVGRYPYHRQVDLKGSGLVLVPSAFWTGHPLITWDPLDYRQHVLIYPAYRDPGDEPDPAARTVVRDALATLLGPTRAAVLRSLGEPRTTSGLAERARISVSSASQHATALREAGLITSRREGRIVRHQLAALGHTLLDRNAPV